MAESRARAPSRQESSCYRQSVGAAKNIAQSMLKYLRTKWPISGAATGQLILFAIRKQTMILMGLFGCLGLIATVAGAVQHR